MVQRNAIIEKRMEALRPVPDEAKIIIQTRVRRRIFRRFKHFVRQGDHLLILRSYSITAAGFFIVAPALALAFLMLWKGDGSLDLAIILQDWRILVGFLVVAGLLVFGARFLHQSQRRKDNAFLEAHTRKFDQENAKHWSKAAKITLETCAKEELADPVTDFLSNKKFSFRVLVGYLPVPFFELRRPKEFVGKSLSEKKQEFRKTRLFIIDCLSGGILNLLGSMPGPRFFRSSPASSDPIAHDLYWRNDVQEVPDAAQADIYLRFHQSVIEESHENTCFYKTFATLNNFRQTSILLLTVKDIVDSLTDPNNEYRDDHAKIYKNLTVNSSNIIDHLTNDIFTRYPPPPYRANSGEEVRPPQWAYSF